MQKSLKNNSITHSIIKLDRMNFFLFLVTTDHSEKEKTKALKREGMGEHMFYELRK